MSNNEKLIEHYSPEAIHNMQKISDRQDQINNAAQKAGDKFQKQCDELMRQPAAIPVEMIISIPFDVVIKAQDLLDECGKDSKALVTVAASVPDLLAGKADLGKTWKAAYDFNHLSEAEKTELPRITVTGDGTLITPGAIDWKTNYPRSEELFK